MRLGRKGDVVSDSHSFPPPPLNYYKGRGEKYATAYVGMVVDDFCRHSRGILDVTICKLLKRPYQHQHVRLVGALQTYITSMGSR